MCKSYRNGDKWSSNECSGISEEVDMNSETVWLTCEMILTEDLELKEVCQNDGYKSQQWAKNEKRNLLIFFSKVLEEFHLSEQIATCDETCVIQYDLEKKKHNNFQ
jgi:hypothetical protein